MRRNSGSTSPMASILIGRDDLAMSGVSSFFFASGFFGSGFFGSGFLGWGFGSFFLSSSAGFR